MGYDHRPHKPLQPLSDFIEDELDRRSGGYASVVRGLTRQAHAEFLKALGEPQPLQRLVRRDADGRLL